MTVAIGTAGIAAGCSSGAANLDKFPSSGSDASIRDAGCPAELPTNGAPCDLPSTSALGPVFCDYDSCLSASCSNGTWSIYSGCNPPGPVTDAALDARPDVSDATPDGEGQDGGQVADAAGDVARDVEGE